MTDVNAVSHASTHSDTAAPFVRKYGALAETLGAYFDALYYSDAEKIEEVFHPNAIYATADETPPLYRTKAEYVAVIAKRESPAERNEPRRDEIDEIQIVGQNTAHARVRTTIGSRDFVDLLTLVRDGGRWQIIAKVFQITEHEGER